MDYVVLARKLRPMRFQDLVGQETVGKALRNAVQTGRIAHAYLFTGSRGIGKTSTARILTKAINCASPQEGEPCNSCENCREITQNSAQDVFEIDAASNRGIDNIRELRENAKYTPTKCAYKTYIIDEVHMLTMESFNALLKTLEEPPSRVIFILATTSPHRIPETILSRCQRYDFPRIPLTTMVDYLARATEAEGLTFGRGGLEVIARNAAGGMRDALTAVDQVVAFAGGSPSDEQVAGVLGLMDQREVHSLLEHILDKSLARALAQFGEVVAHGHDIQILLEKLLAELKDMTVFHTLPEGNTYFQDHSPAALEFYSANKAKASLDQLQQLFYLLLDLETQLKQSEFATACFEMALVKACSVEPLVGVPDLLDQVRRLTQGSGALSVPGVQSPSLEAVRPPPQSVPDIPPEGAPREREGSQSSAVTSGSAGDEAGGDPLPATSGQPAAATPPDQEFPAGQEPGAPETLTPMPSAPSVQTSPEAQSPAPPEDRPEQEPATPPQPSKEAGTIIAAPLSPAPGDITPVSERSESAAPDRPTAEAMVSPSGPAASAPEENFTEFDPDQVPPVGSLPCEDGRWRAFTEAVSKDRPKLGADLRRAEVDAIEDSRVTIVPAEGSPIETLDEQELARDLRAAFGDAFLLIVDRDRNDKARPTHSQVGRDQQLEQARVALERRDAVEDEAVKQITQYFPQAKVKFARPKEGKRRNDV